MLDINGSGPCHGRESVVYGMCFVLVVRGLIILSLARYKYLEMPAQRWIRANFAERGRGLCRFMDFRTKRLAEK